eukprot:TRINITY_DN3266_c0_g1_i1.p1 TRINITY_DN3266_c0_g1~~TRINITY_DN3266_c0_g1_i1.p1  ORF type:complete len:784 (-),score=143.60 TRINITY_DN3266_c0_g1_i1:1851-4202(-)
MYVFLVFNFVGAVVGTIYLLRTYASWQRVPWYAYFVTALGWFCAISVVYLVPADFAAMYANTESSFYQRIIIAFVWKGIYWICFFLTWVIAPFMQDFVDSGGFTFWEKMKYSLRINILFYGCAGVLGIGFLIFLVVHNQFGFSQIMDIAVSVGNAFGLCLLLLFCGYGFVDVPRGMWRAANRQTLLKRNEFEAAGIIANREKAAEELRAVVDAVGKVRAAVPLTNKELSPLVEIISSKLPQLDVEAANAPSRGSRRIGAADEGDQRQTTFLPNSVRHLISKMKPDPKEDKKKKSTESKEYHEGEVTRSELIDLNRRVMVALAIKAREDYFWEELCVDHFDLDDELKNYQDGTRRGRIFRSTLRPSRQGRWAPVISRLEWWWRVWLYPIGLRVAAVFLSLLSLVIVWSNFSNVITAFHGPDTSIIMFLAWGTRRFDWSSGSPVQYGSLPSELIQALITPVVIYMLLCSLHSLFRLRIWNFYALFRHGHSAPSSLLFSAAYMSRLAAPLAFNVLNMGRFIDLPDGNMPAFVMAVNNMSVVAALGTDFPTYAGISLIVFCLLTVFNVGARLANCFSQCCCKCCVRFTQFLHDEDFYDSRMDEGRKALAGARANAETDFKLAHGSAMDQVSLTSRDSYDDRDGDMVDGQRRIAFPRTQMFQEPKRQSTEFGAKVKALMSRFKPGGAAEPKAEPKSQVGGLRTTPVRDSLPQRSTGKMTGAEAVRDLRRFDDDDDHHGTDGGGVGTGRLGLPTFGFRTAPATGGVRPLSDLLGDKEMSQVRGGGTGRR